MAAPFNDTQERTLKAAMDRLIPEDDFPGAWDTGCGGYLCGQLNAQLEYMTTMYCAGLDGLEAEARAEFAKGFAEISAEQQDDLLGRVETNDVRAEWATPPAAFFSALVNHTAEGYYADPGQGGNRDRISWKMIGFNGR